MEQDPEGATKKKKRGHLECDGGAKGDVVDREKKKKDKQLLVIFFLWIGSLSDVETSAQAT